MPANPHRGARRKAGFRTQQDLADAIGWHKSSVANIESGHNKYPKWLELLLSVIAENIELKKRASS